MPCRATVGAHSVAVLCATLMLSGCRTPEPAGPAVPLVVTFATPDGLHVAQGALVTKKLPFSGVPRIFLAAKRTALEAMPGDTVLLNGGGLLQTKETLRDEAGPRWRGLKDGDAALLPVGLYIEDHDKPVALEALADNATGLPAAPAVLMKLADSVPLR